MPVEVGPFTLLGQVPEGMGAATQGLAAFVVVVLNRCTFTVGNASQAAWESFVWIPVNVRNEAWELPEGLHAYEALHWRQPGALLDATRGAFLNLSSARFEGAPEGPLTVGGTFDVTVHTADGGEVRVNGTAPAPVRTQDHPDRACCRTFARGPQGLLAVDFTSGDQPQGEVEGGCTVRTDAPRLRELLGASEAHADCVHIGPYNFTAEVRILP